MPCAGIEWVDRQGVREGARALAVEMASRHPEIERVILFGSFARGRGGPRSDLDLVVVVSETDWPPRERSVHYRPSYPRPLDLYVYTREEVAAFASDPPPVLREALTEGEQLFPAAA